MTTYKRMTRVEMKRLEHKLERTDAPHYSHDELTVPGIVVAQLMRKVAKVTAIAFFSLTFSACTTYTYDARTCPAPLTASGCAQYLGGK